MRVEQLLLFDPADPDPATEDGIEEPFPSVSQRPNSTLSEPSNNASVPGDPLRLSETNKEIPLTASHEESLSRVWKVYEKHFLPSQLKAAYYPYVNLTHTIRRRFPFIRIRISDFFYNQPDSVIEAVGHILFRKLLRLRPIKRMVEICREAEHQIFTQFPVERRSNIRKRSFVSSFRPPCGKVHDLREIYADLTDSLFGGDFPKILVFWSAKAVKSYWGKYYTTEPPRIVLNSRLDDRGVPEPVVSVVLYHEMLHHYFGIDSVNGRRRIHTREFREAEKRHPDYEHAERFLKDLVGARRGTRKRIYRVS